jgi:hypothetical protein
MRVVSLRREALGLWLLKRGRELSACVDAEGGVVPSVQGLRPASPSVTIALWLTQMFCHLLLYQLELLSYHLLCFGA